MKVPFEQRVPPEAREAYRYDAMTALFMGVSFGAIYPFLGRIARGDLHASPLGISLMTAAPFVGNLLSPFWARQMEGRAKLPFIIWAWIGTRTCFLLMVLASTPWTFVILASLAMMIAPIATPAYTSVMKEVYPDDCRGRIMGLIRVWLQTTTFVTTLVAGRLLDLGKMSYRVLFLAGGLFGIMGALSFSRMPVASKGEEGPRFSVLETFRIFLEDRNYRWFGLSVFVYGLGNLIALPIYTLFQVDRLHVTNTQVANLANIASLTAIGAYFFWGHYLDRYGALQTVLVNVLLASLVPLTYLFAQSIQTLYFAAVVNGVMMAGIELSYLNAILAFADDRRIAQYQSLHSLLLGVRGTLGPFIGTTLLSFIGMEGIFVLSIFLILVGAGMQYFGVKGRYRPVCLLPAEESLSRR